MHFETYHRSSAPAPRGIDGNDFESYVSMDAAAVKPFVLPFLQPSPLPRRAPSTTLPVDSLCRVGKLGWTKGGVKKRKPATSYYRRCPSPYYRTLHQPSNRGSESHFATSDELQCGVGMEGGLKLTTPSPMRTLEAQCAISRPSAMLFTDEFTAYQSIFQDTMIEEIVVSRPNLVGFWVTCSAQHEALLIFLDNGDHVQVTSLFQGCGLSPEFCPRAERAFTGNALGSYKQLPYHHATYHECSS